MSGTRLEDKPADHDHLEASRPQQQQQQQHVNYPRAAMNGDLDDGAAEEDGSPNAGLKELIQFFKQTPPPPTSYMSTPDDFSGGSSEEDRWDKFKTRVLRRRSTKTRKRRPPPILLPDSAVAARTTDGHRYIAISIPTEHSSLAPLPASQYPVYDSVEAAFHREVNSRFGMWMNPPSSARPVTVLNPVPEDSHESMSSSSPPSTTSEPPGPAATVPSDRPMRVRPHSVSLFPSREQRYTPRKSRDPVGRRSIGDAQEGSRLPGLAEIPQNQEGGRDDSMPATSDTSPPSPPSPRSHGAPSGAAPKKHTGVSGSPPSPVLQGPMITLTLPSRTSSRRGKQPEPIPLEPMESITGTVSSSSPTTDDIPSSSGNGHAGGLGAAASQPRGSFAASIETMNYSPQLLKAQTAIAFNSVPIVVRPPAAGDLISPLDLDFPRPPTGRPKDMSHAVQRLTPPPMSAVTERSESREERMRERKRRDIERLRAQIGDREKEMLEREKGKESASRPSGSILPDAYSDMHLGGHGISTDDDVNEEEDDYDGRGRRDQQKENHSASPSPSPSPSSSTSLPTKFSDHDPLRAPSDAHTSKTERRRDREARYVAKALAAERETLESLPRSELIQRYEELREQRIYERERRLRRLEHSRDSWVRAVPVLLRDLNALLREQRRILEGAGLTTTTRGAFAASAGSSSRHQHQQQHQHQHQRYHHQHRPQRSRSVDVSSGSPPSDHSLGPIETRRSRSLGSGGSHSSRRSSGWHSG
ncbi:hypothetical protein F5Y14DRAFT_450776 [Nemania sp. NC0429]|nr:hypothetical protein F5Y14DRAFT_450776 [Nemania sp. NC0429]